MQKTTIGVPERTVEGAIGAVIAGCLVLVLREVLQRLVAPVSLSIGGYMKEMTVASYWSIRLREVLTWEVWGVCLLVGGALGVAAYWIKTMPLPAKQSMVYFRCWFLISLVILVIVPRVVGLFYWALFTGRPPLVEHWGAFLVGTVIGLGTTLFFIWLLWKSVELSNYILERWWE